MTKKSIILTLLLMGGLVIPQETKPAETLILLGGATVMYIYAYSKFEGHIEYNYLKKYGIKEQSDIKKYKVHTKLSKKQTTFFERTFIEDNYEKLSTQIIEFINSNKECKYKTLTLTCSIISELNNKEYIVKIIKMNRLPKAMLGSQTNNSLFDKLQRIFLVNKNHFQNNTNTIIKGTLLAVVGTFLMTVDTLILTCMFFGSC